MKAFVKASSLFALLALSSLALAEAGGKGEGFEKMKQEHLANLDKRIQGLQEAKSCVAAAQNHEAMRQCREKMMAEGHEMREQHMEKREERIDERMKHLEAEKAKLQQEKNGSGKK